VNFFASRRFETVLLWLGALPFAAAFLLWYPPIGTYMDENIYIGLANVLRHGTIYADQAGIQVPFLTWNGEHLVAFFPLGMPLLIAGVSYWNWQAMFLINAVAILIGFFLFARWLRADGLHPWYAWLYLYYPTVLFYSRTVMADVLCMVTIFASCWYFRQGRYSLAGLLAGFAPHTKITGVLLLPTLFAAGAARTDRVVVLRKFLLGAFPGLALLFLHNAATTGHFWASPYLLPAGQETLSFVYCRTNFMLFSQSLFFLYPFMPLFLCAGWKRFQLPAVFTVLFLLFHLCVPTSWITGNQWGNWPQRLVLQIRYLLPVIPFFLLMYADGLDRLSKGRTARWLPLALVPLLISAGLIHSKHQEYLRELRSFQKVLYETVPRQADLFVNYDTLHLMNDIQGKRPWTLVSDAKLLPLPPEGKLVFYSELVQRYGNRPTKKSPVPMRLITRVEGKLASLSIYRLSREL